MAQSQTPDYSHFLPLEKPPAHPPRSLPPCLPPACTTQVLDLEMGPAEVEATFVDERGRQVALTAETEMAALLRAPMLRVSRTGVGRKGKKGAD